MAKQLAFWKYEDGMYLDNREVFNTACLEGRAVTGLAKLPLQDILLKVKKVFREYERFDDYTYGGLEGNFKIHAQAQAVMFDCSLRMSDEELGKIIDLMKGFGCPYYDPQTDTRYDK
ncbi:MAG: hypothetical protein J5777_08315 [Clostridiales bacterium]|nr:hypothetical protein [Clostridiales bacterium]